jgi:hypothetical protein
MTHTEALRLALRAMESFQNGTNGLYEGEFEEEITAIKAALAARPEPVAWFWFDERDGGEWIHIADNQVNAEKFGDAKVIPLYTTPPQRKPLTDEQIVEIYTKWEATKGTSWADLMRDIEAAHGIKEES